MRESRSIRKSFRVTPQENKQLQNESKKAKLKEGKYIREKLF